MQLIKLGQLFKITSGGTPSKNNEKFYENGNIPWIKTGDLKSKEIYNALGYITELGVEKSSAKVFPKNTVLIAMYGATIGATSILKIEATTNQACCAFLPSSDVLPEYLYYFFKENKEKIIAMGVGGAQPNISATILKEIRIPLIDLEKQKKIVKILDKAQSLIDKRKAQIKALDELVKSRFIEMFGDPKVNPYNWNVEQLSELVEVPPQNGLYKPASEYVSDNSGVLILRIDAFYDGKVTDFSQLKRLKCTDSEIEKYLLNEQDIVINRVNSIEYLGKCALIEGMQENTVFESNIMRFHLKEKLMNACFATRLLCSQYVYEQIVTCAKKAVNQASINQKDVLSFKLYVPPLDLQKEFAGFVNQVDKLKFEMEKSLKELEDNFNSLMQKAFNGELFN
jgi:type I restriction enzyme S subunit